MPGSATNYLTVSHFSHCARLKSSSKNRGNTTIPFDLTALWDTRHQRRKVSLQWTRSPSCTNNQTGPLSGGMPITLRRIESICMKHVEFLNLIRVVSLRIVLSFFFIFLAVVTLTPQVHAASNNSKTLETAQTTPKSDKYSLETTGREVSTSKYGAWMVTCSIEAQSDTEECSAIYEIVDKQKGITLMSWLVGFSKKQMLM